MDLCTYTHVLCVHSTLQLYMLKCVILRKCLFTDTLYSYYGAVTNEGDEVNRRPRRIPFTRGFVTISMVKKSSRVLIILYAPYTASQLFIIIYTRNIMY